MLNNLMYLLYSVKSRNESFGAPVSHSTPESSQTESEDISPQIQRRRKVHSHSTSAIPKFSISGDEETIVPT